MLTCHETALTFVQNLWSEIKANIEAFKRQNRDVDEELKEWLQALDYVMPMADDFVQNQLPHFMEPVSSWIISLIREARVPSFVNLNE